MTADIIAIVNSIPDRQPATVTLTDLDGKRRQIACVFKESDAPSFFLLFAPDTLPSDISKEWRCIFVSKDQDGKAITFSAKIIDITSTRVIELTANKSIRPEDLREYFRVNIKASIEVYYDPEPSDENEQPFELGGETVDISQTGVLTILPEECKQSKRLTLELNLPNPAEIVICSGRVVRAKRIRKNRWLTSFQFDNISPKAKDIIAKNCFSEQRRQLRENIRTAG